MPADTADHGKKAKLPDLAAVQTIEICEGEHIADSRATGISVDAQIPQCDGCFFQTGSATIDRNYDTAAVLGIGPGATQNPFIVRVEMPAGFVYSGPRSVGPAVTGPTFVPAGTTSAGTFDVHVKTYLGGTLQDDVTVFGGTTRVGETPLIELHTAAVSQPFDAFEYIVIPSAFKEPVTFTLHEFCVQVRAET